MAERRGAAAVAAKAVGDEDAGGGGDQSPDRAARRSRPVLIGTAFEDEARRRGHLLIAGVDEVGRGALAGPVVAGAVILDPLLPWPKGLDDSKKLSPAQRERIADVIRKTAIAFAVGSVPAEEIDALNILVATHQAMLKAIRGLSPAPDFLLIDALTLKESALPQRAIIRGDAVSASIAAASVVAKTYRDALMRDYHHAYPQYGFARHVGYGTQAHLDALRACGPCEIHRKSFRGVLPIVDSLQ
ncbi:MAG: ribonuclease HII [Pyrinomonadaceae bacterium]